MNPIWAIMPVAGAEDYTEAAISDVLAQSVPTRLLLVNQGVDIEFRRRLERIAEAHEERVFVWSHEPSLPSLAATWNRALRFVWETGGTEAWVVNNDARFHRDMLRLLSKAREYTDALFVSGVGVTEEQFAALPAVLDTDPPSLPKAFFKDNGPNIHRGGPDFSSFVISKACHDLFRFDEHHIPCYAEDLTYHRELLLGGCGHRIFSVPVPYWHIKGGSGTLKSLDPAARQALERRIDGSRAYYQQAWGGPVNQETFTIKGNPSSATSGVSTPELQAVAEQGQAS